MRYASWSQIYEEEGGGWGWLLRTKMEEELLVDIFFKSAPFRLSYNNTPWYVMVNSSLGDR